MFKTNTFSLYRFPTKSFFKLVIEQQHRDIMYSKDNYIKRRNRTNVYLLNVTPFRLDISCLLSLPIYYGRVWTRIIKVIKFWTYQIKCIRYQWHKRKIFPKAATLKESLVSLHLHMDYKKLPYPKYKHKYTEFNL